MLQLGYILKGEIHLCFLVFFLLFLFPYNLFCSYTYGQHGANGKIFGILVNEVLSVLKE